MRARPVSVPVPLSFIDVCAGGGVRQQAVTKESFPSDDFAESLKDGVVLCKCVCPARASPIACPHLSSCIFIP